MIMMLRAASELTPLDVVYACSRFSITCTVFNSKLSIADRKKRFDQEPSSTPVQVIYFDSIKLLMKKWHALSKSRLRLLVLVNSCDEYDIKNIGRDSLNSILKVCKRIEESEPTDLEKPVHIHDMVTNAMKHNMQQSIVHKLSMSLYSVKDKVIRDSMRKDIMRYLAGSRTKPDLTKYPRISRLMSDSMIPALRKAVVLSRSIGAGGPDIASAKTNIDRFDIAYIESYITKK
jgi:hypothetical protein